MHMGLVQENWPYMILQIGDQTNYQFTLTFTSACPFHMPFAGIYQQFGSQCKGQGGETNPSDEDKAFQNYTWQTVVTNKILR